MKIIIVSSCFSKQSIVDVWQDSEYVSGSEYHTILDMSLVLNVPQFWIYPRVLNMPLDLNMPGFSIYQSSEYSKVMQGSEYAWLIPEHTGICVNMPKSAWMALVLHFPTSPFVLQSRFYFNRWLLVWTSTGD